MEGHEGLPDDMLTTPRCLSIRGNDLGHVKCADRTHQSGIARKNALTRRGRVSERMEAKSLINKCPHT